MSRRRGLFGRFWRWVQARFRLDLEAVCELSAGRGPFNDFHDYDDTAEKFPDHMALLTCVRCGKQFYI